MALQTAMGPSSEIYVTKTAFYWSIGIIILLLAAVTFSMTRDITRLSIVNRDRPVASEANVPMDSSSELPPLPPMTTEPPAITPDSNPSTNPNLQNPNVETVNPDIPPLPPSE